MFEARLGAFSQHDFGQVEVTFVGGRKKRVRFFASLLKFSRFVAVSLVDDERVETLVRGLARHFVAFSGLPLMAVFDRPRTIVQESGKGRGVDAFNATFAQAIVDHVRAHQGVTLATASLSEDDSAARRGDRRDPIVEDDVVLHAGVTVVGPVTIGRGSRIGGNAWLTRSVPPGSRITQALARSETFDGGAGL